MIRAIIAEAERSSLCFECFMLQFPLIGSALKSPHQTLPYPSSTDDGGTRGTGLPVPELEL